MLGITTTNARVGGFRGGVSAQTAAFRTRVIADGGTFEAITCLNSTIKQLQSLNQIATTFNLLVLADGGTFEQINCVQTNITNLQNININ